MADLAYMRNRPTTLQDLLNQANLQPDAPVETPAPPQPSQVATEGTMTPQDRQKLLDMLLQPESQGPEPQVDKPSALAMLFSGLGDAVTGFVAGKSGNPGYQSNFFDQYQNKLNQQKADLQAYHENSAKAKNRSRERTASYLLNEADRVQSRSDAAAERKALLDQTQALKREEDRQRTEERTADRAARQQEFDAKKSWDLEMEKARFGHEQAVAGIRLKAAQGDDIAKDDKKALGPILGTISALAMTAKKNLAEGKTTPEELQGLVEQMADEGMLSPEARKAMEAHFHVKLGATLRDYAVEQQSKDLAAGSPNASMGGSAYPILERLGGVKTPQRY